MKTPRGEFSEISKNFVLSLKNCQRLWKRTSSALRKTIFCWKLQHWNNKLSLRGPLLLAFRPFRNRLCMTFRFLPNYPRHFNKPAVRPVTGDPGTDSRCINTIINPVAGNIFITLGDKNTGEENVSGPKAPAYPRTGDSVTFRKLVTRQERKDCQWRGRQYNFCKINYCNDNRSI